uniref:Uncharacterized protein n=1 Tax=Glossina palpalis gambiensis TaxID=67801 RepID=A0A1B0BF10_9MUSC
MKSASIVAFFWRRKNEGKDMILLHIHRINLKERKTETETEVVIQMPTKFFFNSTSPFALAASLEEIASLVGKNSSIMGLLTHCKCTYYCENTPLPEAMSSSSFKSLPRLERRTLLIASSCCKLSPFKYNREGFEDAHLSGILLVYEHKRLFEQFIQFVIKAVPLFIAFNQRRVRHSNRRPLYTLNKAISQSIALSNRTIWQIAAMLENETRRTLNYLRISLVNYCTDHSGLIQSSSLIAGHTLIY